MCVHLPMHERRQPPPSTIDGVHTGPAVGGSSAAAQLRARVCPHAATLRTLWMVPTNALPMPVVRPRPARPKRSRRPTRAPCDQGDTRVVLCPPVLPNEHPALEHPALHHRVHRRRRKGSWTLPTTWTALMYSAGLSAVDSLDHLAALLTRSHSHVLLHLHKGAKVTSAVLCRQRTLPPATLPLRRLARTVSGSSYTSKLSKR